ncbi:DnaJ domain-containing protein [Aquabacter cavernae]|uniref:DnaJ domain-containing protein n=1 Tax=Aquabacter cavernae TaxID=2496029 RepID=UPI000F8E63D1|nr:DnaJ domain-containing protein [Aquabacter cavernae]
MTLLAGVAVLGLLLYLFSLWSKANPKVLARRLIEAGGVACLLGAAGLLVTGRFMAAMALGGAGLALLGRSGGKFSGLFKGRTAPKVSRVRSPWFEMELDHGSGALAGSVLAGPLAGSRLDDLSLDNILAMRPALDAQSLALIEAYLDRRAPAWRENAEGDTGRRRSGEGLSRSAMTEQEAYEVLGLEQGAGEAEVRRAHRALMKKLHPDHGGSDYLAARVNQAKDIILSKHR